MSFIKSAILALVAATPLVSASPVARQFRNATEFAILAAPIAYSGPYTSFPSIDTWKTFDELFDINKSYMNQAGSTWDDIGRIYVGISGAAATIGVDERVILCMIMQESHGYVGVETSFSPGEGIPTAGLMQCSGCAGFPGQTGLSQDQINEMINGGTQHYKGNLEDFGDLLATSSIYPALREYNSGSVDESNLSNGLGATDSYVSDISQRLQGWAD